MGNPNCEKLYVLRTAIGITGGRDRLPTKDQRRAIAQMRLDPRKVHLVHGGARGIDQAINKRARQLGWITTGIFGDWPAYNSAAFLIRNAMIVRACDWLLHFGGRGGTKNCYNQAVAFGRTIIDLSGLGPRAGEDVSVPLKWGRTRRPWGDDRKRDKNGNLILPLEVADHVGEGGGSSRTGSPDDLHEEEELGDPDS